MSSFSSCAGNHDLKWQFVHHQVLSWHSGLWHFFNSARPHEHIESGSAEISGPRHASNLSNPRDVIQQGFERIWEYVSQTPVVPCSFLDFHWEGMLVHGQWAVIMTWNGNTRSPWLSFTTPGINPIWPWLGWATLKCSPTTPSVLTIIEYLAMYLPLLNTWQSSQTRIVL